MRAPALAALLVLSLPSFARAADEPTTVQVEVGDEVPLTGFRPICDDPSIATITAEGKGTLKAMKAGVTLCSISVGNAMGQRRIFRVVVIPPPPKRPGGPGGPGPGRSDG